MCAIPLSCESKFIVVHNKKTCRGSGSVASFLITVGTGWGWVTNFTPQAPYPHYLLISRLDYTQSHSGQFGEQMEMTQPGVEQLFPQFSHSYRESWYKNKVLLFTNWCVSELSLKNIEIYIKTAPTFFCVTVTPSSGNALICTQINDDGVTLTPKHVGAVLM